MADDRLQQAVDIVARHVIARAAQVAAEDDWGFYDEFGEDDWREIAQHVEQLAPYPDKDQYQAAYDYLTSRADGKTS